jgi:hypothetical protein
MSPVEDITKCFVFWALFSGFQEVGMDYHTFISKNKHYTIATHSEYDPMRK